MRVRPSSVLATSAWLGLLAGTAYANTLSFGPHDVRSAFYVSKSENNNQIHYGIHLDAACRPVGKTPVFAYWRRLKNGARVDAALEGMGTRFYGASDEQGVTRSAEGGRVHMYVKAVKQLQVDIAIVKKGTSCVATATTQIAKAPAVLNHAHLQLGMLGLSVKYMDVFGKRISDGKAVTQRID
jgi:hypothetical protein